MKKLVSAVLALMMIAGCVIMVSADEPSSWAEEEVGAAIAAGLVPEELQKNYTSPVTRGQVAGMFINLLEKASGKTAEELITEHGSAIDETAFTDTDDMNVFAANALGIINGTGHNKFSPYGTLKRAQIAAIINRTAGVMGFETEGFTHGFTDITDNYSWAYDELGWPVENGIIKGVGGTRFSPGGDLTTEQAILITYRAYTVLKKTGTLGGDYSRVVIFGVDGGGAFFKEADTPNIDRIFANGAITYTAQALSPSYSGVNWGSMLHGSLPGAHRLDNSSDTPYPMNTSVPSIFHVIRDADPDCALASIVNWNIINAGIIEDAEAINVHKDKGNEDSDVADKIVEYLDTNVPKLLFMQFDSVDEAGHSDGYGRPEHLNAIHEVDGYIGRIYDKYEELGLIEDTLFILSPDHGGTQKQSDDGDWSGSHGGSNPEEMNIMVAVAGKTVVKNGEIGEMLICDISSIVLYALGIEQPAGYVSRVPSGVFEGVEASDRPEYKGLDNKRFEHEGEDTPQPGSGRYITDFIPAEDIISYSTFDGFVKNEIGTKRMVNKGGAASYTDGYYGEAFDLSTSYMFSGHTPEKDSFTVSLWLKVTAAGGDPPLITNQYYYIYKYEKADYGLTLRLNSSRLSVIMGDGCADKTDELFETQLPDDYREGWVHLDLIVDREAGKIGLSIDFGEIEMHDIPSGMLDVVLNGNFHGLILGSDASTAKFDFPGYIDDVIIFSKALTQDDINALAEYYQVR